MASENLQDSVANAINVPLAEPPPEEERRLLNQDVPMEEEPNSALEETQREEEPRTQAEILRELNRVRSELHRWEAGDEALMSSRGGEAGPRQSS